MFLPFPYEYFVQPREETKPYNLDTDNEKTKMKTVPTNKRTKENEDEIRITITNIEETKEGNSLTRFPNY